MIAKLDRPPRITPQNKDKIQNCLREFVLTLKAPITTAADDNFCDIFLIVRKKEGMVFRENRLPADDSHEISYLICYF